MGSCFIGSNFIINIKSNIREEKPTFYIDTINKKCISTTTFSIGATTHHFSKNKLPLSTIHSNGISEITLNHNDNDKHSLREIYELLD